MNMLNISYLKYLKIVFCNRKIDPSVKNGQLILIYYSSKVDVIVVEQLHSGGIEYQHR